MRCCVRRRVRFVSGLMILRASHSTAVHIYMQSMSPPRRPPKTGLRKCGVTPVHEGVDETKPIFQKKREGQAPTGLVNCTRVRQQHGCSANTNPQTLIRRSMVETALFARAGRSASSVHVLSVPDIKLFTFAVIYIAVVGSFKKNLVIL